MPRGGNTAEAARQTKAVSQYLEALEAGLYSRPRGMTMQTRLAKVEDRLRAGDLSAAQRVILIQKRMNYLRALEAEQSADPALLEADFIAACQPFSERHGISYAAWREMGVPARVLKAAGWAQARKGNRKPSRSEPTSPPEASQKPRRPRKRAAGTSDTQTRTSPATEALVMA